MSRCARVGGDSFLLVVVCLAAPKRCSGGLGRLVVVPEGTCAHKGHLWVVIIIVGRACSNYVVYKSLESMMR